MKLKYVFFMIGISMVGGVPMLGASLQALAQETTDYKKLCREAREELKNTEKSLKAWDKEKAPIQKEHVQVKKKFFSIQDSIKKQTGCSEGNPNNTSQCEKKLQEARSLGKRMNELDANLAKVNKKYRKMERKRLLSQKKLEVYRCR